MKILKKIIKIIYYLFCLILILFSFHDMPEIEASLYDLIIHKVSTTIIISSFLIPLLFIKKYKKWWSKVFGFILIFIITIIFGVIIDSFHSKDFKERINEYNKTEIIYNQLENKIENIITNKTNDLKEEQEKNNITKQYNNKIQNKEIKIHYIDVGQGDAIFIELLNNQTMLIDAGEQSKGQLVSEYIKKLGYNKINYLVGTHPHTDHIGGLANIINNFEIENIYMPKALSTSKTYENLLNTINNKKLKVTTAKAGVNILKNDKITIDIIAPNQETYSNLNNYSAVIKIKYLNKTFLFMGDAETKSENEINEDVIADVIKIGHHGSDSSSGLTFINKVKAKYVIIMVGINNKYDHPYQNIIDRWINTGASIYRTDTNGNIVASSDGNKINIKTDR